MEISSHLTYCSQGRKDLLEKENAQSGLFDKFDFNSRYLAVNGLKYFIVTIESVARRYKVM